MTEQELNLLKFAAGLVAQPRTRAAEVMWRYTGHAASRTRVFHHPQITFGLNP
jgi:hypothetical protein